jgi:hypothetical protein
MAYTIDGITIPAKGYKIVWKNEWHLKLKEL